MSDIELIAINKELMPSSQRYIPSTWKKFRNALKKRQGFQLNWTQVSANIKAITATAAAACISPMVDISLTNINKNITERPKYRV